MRRRRSQWKTHCLLLLESKSCTARQTGKMKLNPDMIQLTGAGKRYGPKILFENVDWLVTPSERAGIVGANGTGKSRCSRCSAGIEGSIPAS